MNDFIKRWNSDKRFKTSIQLTLYTAFVIIVAIFAISNRNVTPLNEIDNNLNSQQKEEDSKQNEKIIKVPNKYEYSIKIKINNVEYLYLGTKNKERETIIKKINEKTTNYINENNNYYQEIDNNYILISQEEVYDIVNYNYINLENINKYLEKSEKVGNQYLVYLKDIILGNVSDEYIIINIINNKINIDYTPLIKSFDKEINNYKVNIEIKEIE